MKLHAKTLIIEFMYPPKLMIVMSLRVIKLLTWTKGLIISFAYLFHAAIILIVMIFEPMSSISHKHDWLPKEVKYDK